ncbi:glycerate kinase [Corynebacterium liangguodongii]|uniref:Glycerate kinase n=1 Tax=Corynebacterium liangguodongii TaxID=2079535 RepID=A0A2S0WER4_9CORY|nr:glycerate kinase [Corynebacterium liangguodongii]AWB84275.1 glycerate kinase [Corynebacterium liangguodongii]PWC00284.1 glycerate kinase [Corynebacterium liangguodongii]
MTRITPENPASCPTIVIAPDAFKSTATAQQAAQWLSDGVASVTPHAHVITSPMADGGEGTSALFDGELITLPTTDAAGRLTEASYTFDAASATAYIDVAAASGLPKVADHPVATTGDTFGTGVLIADAETRGARRIVMGLGGSATVDGGTGILVALGVNPLNSAGYSLNPGGAALIDLADFDTAKVNIPAASVDWVLLADALVPATGPDGAAAVFGPQKGASEADVDALDRALARLCEVTGVDGSTPGFGAAGAIPVGLHWLSRLLHGNDDHVQVLPGAQVVAEASGLAARLAGADFVITGEGRCDSQTAKGKVVSVVIDAARRSDANPAVAVVSGEFRAPLPEGVTAVTLDELGDDVGVQEQLTRAGARAAEAYLRISTAQG